MEQIPSQPNLSYDPIQDDANGILTSYMNFITTSNSAVRSILDILYSQQVAFNHIINTRPRNINLASSYARDLPQRNYTTHTFDSSMQYARRDDVNQLPAVVFPSGPNIAQYFDNLQSNNTNIPSADDRDAAIEYITFCRINEPLNTTCPISHRDFSANDTVIQLHQCRHIFDSSSILQWFTRNSLCPLCRNDIRSTSEETNTPASTPLPFAEQLAAMISEQLSTDRDFSGNINIELAIPGPSSEE
jgi:hypothetical protein